MNQIRSKKPRLRQRPIRTRSSAKMFCEGTAGDAKDAAQRRTLKFIINNIAAGPGMIQNGTKLHSVQHATRMCIVVA